MTNRPAVPQTVYIVYICVWVVKKKQLQLPIQCVCWHIMAHTTVEVISWQMLPLRHLRMLQQDSALSVQHSALTFLTVVWAWTQHLQITAETFAYFTDKSCSVYKSWKLSSHRCWWSSKQKLVTEIQKLMFALIGRAVVKLQGAYSKSKNASCRDQSQTSSHAGRKFRGVQGNYLKERSAKLTSGKIFVSCGHHRGCFWSY